MTTLERVIYHAKAGRMPIEIAALTGLERKSVHNYLCKARSLGHDIPRFKKGEIVRRTSSVRVSHLTLGGLCAAASRRGLTERALATNLLEIIIRDGLADAILDDEVSNG